jgi:hypothetical protein
MSLARRQRRTIPTVALAGLDDDAEETEADDEEEAAEEDAA